MKLYPCRTPAAVAVAIALASMAPASASAQGAVTITGVAPVQGGTVPSGTALDQALASLPGTTTITLSDGRSVLVELEWALADRVETTRGSRPLRQEYFATARGPYEARAMFTLPEGVHQADPPVPLELTTRFTLDSGPMLRIDDRDAFNEPGRYSRESISFGDVERTYNVYAPSTYDGSRPVPVVFTFHGAGSYGLGQLFYSGFDQVAEREGFIVVAPDYGVSALGTLTSPGVTEFTSAILDRLIGAYNVDERRVYATGISMGGSASITLAHELGDRIAAIGPVATGARAILEQELPRPTTVVLMYGDQDSGYGPELYRVVERLVGRNGASVDPVVTSWPASAADPTSVHRHRYGGGVGGTEVIFYLVEGGGHTWPGRYQYASIITVGPTTQHIDGTEYIWRHLREHTLPEGQR
jgi:polyhydroxybutyrate depolymerase